MALCLFSTSLAFNLDVCMSSILTLSVSEHFDPSSVSVSPHACAGPDTHRICRDGFLFYDLDISLRLLSTVVGRPLFSYHTIACQELFCPAVCSYLNLPLNCLVYLFADWPQFAQFYFYFLPFFILLSSYSSFVVESFFILEILFLETRAQYCELFLIPS